MKKSLILLLVVAAATACGGGGGPLGLLGPPSPDQIASRPGQSSMKDGHFNISGQASVGANHTPYGGDGLLVLRPLQALQLNLQIDSGTVLGRAAIDLIEIGDMQFIRVGSGPWSQIDQPGTTSTTPRLGLTRSASWISRGEDTVHGDKAWHIERTADAMRYSEWVRESDGYVVRLDVRDDSTDLAMDFDRFNTGRTIKAPI